MALDMLEFIFSDKLISLLIVWLGALAARVHLGKDALRLPYLEGRNLHLGFLDAFIYGSIAWLVYALRFETLNIFWALVFGFGARGIVALLEIYARKANINVKMF